MQVILLEKVVNLGGLGDVVKVKDGYARNYLLPQGKAKRATPESLAEFEKKRTELEKAQSETLAAAQEKGARLEGLMVQITQKAGVDGHLFGSVTNFDIVEALKGQGFEVERSMIRLPQGPLKTVGDHSIAVALHTDVVVHIKISVLGETRSSNAGKPLIRKGRLWRPFLFVRFLAGRGKVSATGFQALSWPSPYRKPAPIPSC